MKRKRKGGDYKESVSFLLPQFSRDRSDSVDSHLSWKSTHFELGCALVGRSQRGSRCSRCIRCSPTSRLNRTGHRTHGDSSFLSSSWASSSDCSVSWPVEEMWAWDWGGLVPPWQRRQGTWCPASPCWCNVGLFGRCWLNKEQKY